MVVDLPNNPAFVIMLLAAAYGGFSLITMNTRLTDAEKQARLLDLQRSRAVNVAYTVDVSNAGRLLQTVADEATGTADAAAHGRGHAQRTAFAARTNIATAEAAPPARSAARATAARRRAVARTLPVKMRWKASSISPNAARMCSTMAPWRWSCSRPAPPAVRRPCP